MKIEDVKIGQLVRVKSAEEVLKIDGSRLIKPGLVATKDGDLYFPDVEGEYAGQVFEVEEITVDGFFLVNCGCEIAAVFLDIATKEEVEDYVGTLKNDLIEEFNELASQNNPTLNKLIALTGESQEDFLINTMQTIIQKLKQEIR